MYSMLLHYLESSFFFFNDTATTEIYTLSLHDALPICIGGAVYQRTGIWRRSTLACSLWGRRCNRKDRKSTRLNSSHQIISYAVFCLKKKKDTDRESGNLAVTAHTRHCTVSTRTGRASH